jgi:hypothetical protein
LRNQNDLFAQSGSSSSWSDFQKKMGVATWCCLREDSEALRTEPLCYRNGETKRTMFMIALLMDEFDSGDAVKFANFIDRN